MGASMRSQMSSLLPINTWRIWHGSKTKQNSHSLYTVNLVTYRQLGHHGGTITCLISMWDQRQNLRLGITIFRYSCQHNVWPIMCSAPGSVEEKDNGAFLMGVNNSTLPPFILTKAASQYIIHRSLIRSRSHQFWKVLLKKLYVLSDRHFRRSVGYLFEYFFFYIFTGLHDELQYMQDGRYLRLDGVSYNNTRNVRRNIWHKTWLNHLLPNDMPGNKSLHVPVPLAQAPLPVLTAIAASRAKARAAAREHERARPSEVKLLRHE